MSVAVARRCQNEAMPPMPEPRDTEGPVEREKALAAKELRKAQAASAERLCVAPRNGRKPLARDRSQARVRRAFTVAPLCVPKIRFCNIDGEGRQGQVVSWLAGGNSFPRPRSGGSPVAAISCGSRLRMRAGRRRANSCAAAGSWRLECRATRCVHYAFSADGGNFHSTKRKIWRFLREVVSRRCARLL
jgi:hypothetical protein